MRHREYQGRVTLTVMTIDEALEAARLRRRLPPPALRRFIRERAGLSQRSIAEAVGVARPSVSRWESGARTPTGPTLASYLNVLKRISETELAS